MTLTGSTVGINGGAGNATINVGAVTCCIVGTGALSSGGATINLTVATGTLGAGPLSATGPITLTDNDNSAPNSGPVNFCGAVTTTGLLTAQSGTQSGITFSVGGGATGGSVLFTAGSGT